MQISRKAKKTNDEVLQEVEGRQLPSMRVKRKLQYFSHLVRKSGNNLEKDTVTDPRIQTQRKTTKLLKE